MDVDGFVCCFEIFRLGERKPEEALVEKVGGHCVVG